MLMYIQYMFILFTCIEFFSCKNESFMADQCTLRVFISPASFELSSLCSFTSFWQNLNPHMIIHTVRLWAAGKLWPVSSNRVSCSLLPAQTLHLCCGLTRAVHNLYLNNTFTTKLHVDDSLELKLDPDLWTYYWL